LGSHAQDPHFNNACFCRGGIVSPWICPSACRWHPSVGRSVGPSVRPALSCAPLLCPPTAIPANPPPFAFFPPFRTGMVWSAFRPSDDRVAFHFNVPGNMYAAAALERALDINRRVWRSHDFHNKASRLARGIRWGRPLNSHFECMDALATLSAWMRSPLLHTHTCWPIRCGACRSRRHREHVRPSICTTATAQHWTMEESSSG
jgi:Metal-independent alpha-mannosidase (GH125)